MFYWAREFTSAISAGGSYANLPRTIVISIIDFTLFDCAEYHSFFQPMEVDRHALMTDKMDFHFFELPKLPGEIDEKDDLSLWLALFNANTEDDLKKIRAMDVPEMNQAIDAYYKVTASKEFQEIERMRERARHDEASALSHAKDEGRAEGLEEGLAKGAFNKTVEALRNIVDSLNLSLDQAMAVLKVPDADRPNYKEILQPQ